MSSAVSLVIPGRNAEATVRACLESVVPLLDEPGLSEILFVDDGSTDRTAEIVATFPVRLLSGEGRGPGAARNLGWHSATSPIVWFMDADCVAAGDALPRLLRHLDERDVAAVGGSYGNMRPDSWLARLIHAEIVERHRTMPREVDFLATFNVLYRRDVLQEVGGFDERFLKGQDAELAYRIVETGRKLRFEPTSEVRHFHATRWAPYLRTQMQQGFWRVHLYLEHPSRTAGDAYSTLLDHLQPPLALGILALLVLAFVPAARAALLLAIPLLGMAQVPMTVRLLRQSPRPSTLAFPFLGFVRSFARGLGLALGSIAVLGERGRLSLRPHAR